MQAEDVLFTTAITRGEMLYGACILPAGRRREQLLDAVQAIFSIDMAGRVLPYDEAAADAHAELPFREFTEGGIQRLEGPAGGADGKAAGDPR